MFYRLILPYLLEFLDRIIYVDIDVLVFDDLSGIYNLSFHNNYILASRNHKRLGKEIKELDINNDNYISSGIILINLYFGINYDYKFLIKLLIILKMNKIKVYLNYN